MFLLSSMQFNMDIFGYRGTKVCNQIHIEAAKLSSVGIVRIGYTVITVRCMGWDFFCRRIVVLKDVYPVPISSDNLYANLSQHF